MTFVDGDPAFADFLRRREPEFLRLYFSSYNSSDDAAEAETRARAPATAAPAPAPAPPAIPRDLASLRAENSRMIRELWPFHVAGDATWSTFHAAQPYQAARMGAPLLPWWAEVVGPDAEFCSSTVARASRAVSLALHARLSRELSAARAEADERAAQQRRQALVASSPLLGRNAAEARAGRRRDRALSPRADDDGVIVEDETRTPPRAPSPASTTDELSLPLGSEPEPEPTTAVARAHAREPARAGKKKMRRRLPVAPAAAFSATLQQRLATSGDRAALSDPYMNFSGAERALFGQYVVEEGGDHVQAYRCMGVRLPEGYVSWYERGGGRELWSEMAAAFPRFWAAGMDDDARRSRAPPRKRKKRLSANKREARAKTRRRVRSSFKAADAMRRAGYEV